MHLCNLEVSRMLQARTARALKAHHASHLSKLVYWKAAPSLAMFGGRYVCSHLYCYNTAVVEYHYANVLLLAEYF